MKKLLLTIVSIGILNFVAAQEIIQVPHEKAEGTTWEGNEKAYFSKIWQNDVVTNVSVPTMEVFRPREPEWHFGNCCSWWCIVRTKYYK